MGCTRSDVAVPLTVTAQPHTATDRVSDGRADGWVDDNAPCQSMPYLFTCAHLKPECHCRDSARRRDVCRQRHARTDDADDSQVAHAHARHHGAHTGRHRPSDRTALLLEWRRTNRCDCSGSRSDAHRDCETHGTDERTNERSASAAKAASGGEAAALTRRSACSRVSVRDRW